MADSPIQQLLDAVDTLDLERVIAMTARDCRMRMVDGRRAAGVDEVRTALSELLSTLRRAEHKVCKQWQEGNLWIAEVDATYELRDGYETAVLPRAFFLRMSDAGISELRIYGAHERPLADDDGLSAGLRLGGRWIPPL
jgi:SnoaL-like domain